MGAKKIPTVSTLTIGENYSRLVDSPEFLDQPLYQATLEASEIDRLKTEEKAKQQARPWTWWMKIMTPIAQENLRMVHEQGGIVATGTDQSLGPALHREMELLVAAGIRPVDAIRCATLNGAIFLGKSRELGSVEEGKLADLVLLEADPTQNIDNAKRIALVVKDGQVIDRSKLDLPVNRR
jgi:imidazolonepropionase-like amidohydrolase